MNLINTLSYYSIPFIMLSIIMFGMWKQVDVFNEFVDGASDGLKIVVKIIPTLVGLLVGIGVFRASGAMDFLIELLRKPAELVGIPPEVLPLAFLRPISGSGSLAVVSDIMTRYGADSFNGRLASVMMGSTETTFYTVAVYFAATKVKNIRYTIAAALFAETVSVIASVVVCRLVYG